MTSPSRRRNRRDSNATQPIQAVEAPPEETTPPVTYSEKAVQDWRGAVGIYEQNAVQAAAQADGLQRQAEMNEKAAAEHREKADENEAQIEPLRRNAEAEAKRLLDATEERIREISTEVADRRRSAEQTAAAAAEQREGARKCLKEAQVAQGAADFTRHSIERVEHERKLMADTPGPKESSVRAVMDLHDQQDAVEGVGPDGETIALPQDAGEQR